MRSRKPSPAMPVALLALFVALGGSSYAAITLSTNSVKSKHIAKGAVKRSEIAKRAVNSAKVADFSLLAQDFKSGQLPTGPQGPQGQQGQQGLKGDKGDTGEPGSAAAYAEVSSSGAVSDAKNISSANITHPATGVYCIGGLAFEIGNAVATMQTASTLDTRDRIAQVLLATAPSIPFGCAAGDRLRVQVVDLGVLGATPAGLVDGFFYVWLED